MGAWKTVIDGDTLLVWLLIELKVYMYYRILIIQKVYILELNRSELNVGYIEFIILVQYPIYVFDSMSRISLIFFIAKKSLKLA